MKQIIFFISQVILELIDYKLTSNKLNGLKSLLSVEVDGNDFETKRGREKERKKKNKRNTENHNIILSSLPDRSLNKLPQILRFRLHRKSQKDRKNGNGNQGR